jgi:hypothetical protein
MSTSNPFGKLKVRRDAEDEELPETTTTKEALTTNQALFTQPQQSQKKKVRPAEAEGTSQPQQDNQEGFSVVRKKIPGKFQNRTLNAEVVHADKERKPPQNKGAFDDRNKVPKAGKRQFDKQSGTGFGKEIKKGGAGGHHTWGDNPKNLARDTEMPAEGDLYSRRDDDYFERVLNPKPKPVKEEAPEVKEPEKKVEEEKHEEAKEEPQGDDHQWRRKKKGGEEEEEIKKEDLLIRPENALSYAEYQAQLKEKNQALNANKKAPAKTQESDLQLKEKKEDLTIGANLGTSTTQKKQKVKERKVDKKEEEMNQNLALKTDDGYQPRKYDKENKTQYGKKSQAGPKFAFKKEDFPEL